MTNLKRIIEETDTLAGRAFDITIQLLIVISLISFSIETLPEISGESRQLLSAIETVTVVLFSIEYLLRLVVAKPKLGFVFSFFGLVDLFAILPFYLSTGVDLRSVRVIRLLRLVRILKIVRYNKAIARFRRAFSLAREELVLFFSAASILLFISAVGIYFFENEAQPEAFASVFHSLWWAVVTLTTVGYGDISPVTAGGKIFTFFMLMIGLGVVAIPSGLMASALSEARRLEAEEAEPEDQ